MKKIINFLGLSIILLTIFLTVSKVEASANKIEYDECMESMWYCDAIATAKGNYYNLTFEQEYDSFIKCLVKENCYMT